MPKTMEEIIVVNSSEWTDIKRIVKALKDEGYVHEDDWKNVELITLFKSWAKKNGYRKVEEKMLDVDECMNIMNKHRYYHGTREVYKGIKAICQHFTVPEIKLPEKIEPDHCDKHKYCMAWSCPNCASYFTHNRFVDLARKMNGVKI